MGDIADNNAAGAHGQHSGCCQPQNCEQFHRRLYFLLDGECDPEESARLQKHLDRCPECAEEIGSVEAIRALLRRCCSQRAPETLRAKITSRIHTRIERSVETRTETVIRSGNITQKTTEYRISYRHD